MKLKTLEDLFVHELQDIYSAEAQILKALPKMVKAAKSEHLRAAFQKHLEETKGQVERLNQVFDERAKPSKGVTCAGMQGLLSEGEELIDENAEPAVKDAGLIVAAQKVEHYEIAAYGSVCVFAEMLGKSNIKKLLKQNLAQEEATDKSLSELAESLVNYEALSR